LLVAVAVIHCRRRLLLYGSPDTVNIEDILSVDVTPLSSISTSGMDATTCPDMSVARSVSVEMGTSMSIDFDDRTREIQDVATRSELDDTVGVARFQNPSLAPNVGSAKLGESTTGTHPLTALGRANLCESPPGTHPLTAQGYTSLGDTAPGMIPSMALGRYTESDDIVQDRFWTSTVRRSRNVDSVSDLSIPEFDSRSEYDLYFVERDTRRESSAMVSASTQVTPHTWTLMVPDLLQLGPHLLSDIGTPPFKKPKTPPPRAVVTTTEMYMRHTSQDVVATAQRGHRRSSSSSTSTGSRIPGPPQTSPRSSVQQGWMPWILRLLHLRLQSYLSLNQCPCIPV